MKQILLNKLEVSVVVPTYNAEKYIKDTLESILLQQNVKMEVIVVDDCSTDRTIEIVNLISNKDFRVKVIQTDVNSGGPATPRNIGIHAATGNWIAFCDADDLWHKQKLYTQIELAEHLKADFVCASMRDFNDKEFPQFKDFSKELKLLSTPLNYWKMILKNRVVTSSVLCKRSILLESLFIEDNKLVAVEDYDLWLRLLELPNFNAIRSPLHLVAYRQNNGSLSSNKFRQLTKVLYVLRSAAIRKRCLWAFPFLVPFILASYISMSLYWRILKKGL